MKSIYKKILVASVTFGVMTTNFEIIAHAANITASPEEPSDNTIEVNETDYSINDTKTAITAGDIYEIYGGHSEDYGDSSRNVINFYGGTADYIYGGWAFEGNTTGNTINIYGGTVLSRIELGWTELGNSTNGILNIYGSPNLTSAEIFSNSNTEAGTITENTLNIYTKGLTAKNIYNFQNINFYLPESTVGGDTILTLTDENTDISGATVKAGVVGNANLNTGDVITLLQNAGTITDDGTTYGKLTEGVSLEYDLTVSKSDDNKIIATIGDVANQNPIIPLYNPLNPDIEIIKPQTVNFILPELPEIPFDTFEEFDLSAEDKKELGIADAPDHKGWEIFADIGGGSMRYKTANGHINTTNQNANLGFARNIGNIANKMTIAPIIDYQNTNYDNYLSDGTHGRGNSKYTGGGFVLRNMNRGGFYYEASFRAGKVKTDFASDNLDTTGLFGRITYDNSATILNGHVKLGKYLRLDKNNLLDIYGFYYHTHQGGSSADLSSGEHYDFSNTNAGKLRIGYRLTTRTSKISQIYTGLAYQYEHNSGITATYKGYSTPNNSHNASSGMLEIGWIVKPLKNNPWTVNINTTGWIGNQRGVKAFAKIQKSF